MCSISGAVKTKQNQKRCSGELNNGFDFFSFSIPSPSTSYPSASISFCIFCLLVFAGALKLNLPIHFFHKT